MPGQLLVGALIAGFATGSMPWDSGQVSITRFTIQGPGDMTLQGAQIGDYGGGVCLRSGSVSPGRNVTSTATVNLALSSGVTVESLGFAYRYETGYKGTVGMDFAVEVGRALLL